MDARTYTVSVARVAGGLAGCWQCSCGEAMAVSTAHVTISDALQEVKRDLARHHQTFHQAQA